MPSAGHRTTPIATLAVGVALLGCSDDVYIDATCTPVDTGPAPAQVAGCGATMLWESPVDFAERGGWPVGVRTARADGLSVEIWYPAQRGSESCGDAKVYDLREWLPESERGKIPDAENPWQRSSSYSEAPLDVDRGPYPVVVFVHGTAGFRTQSLAHMEHWASRGFVVLAADHPGLFLGDALDLKLVRDLPGDIDKVLAALANPSGGFAFLAGHVDLERIGMAGHSAGGAAIADLKTAPGVKVLVPLAAGGTKAAPSLESTLVMGGLADQVVAYDKTLEGYAATPPKKRLLGLSKAGHLFPTELCWLVNDDGQTIVDVANEYQIKNVAFASFLFDCPADQLPREEARDVVNYATSAAFEEVLHCRAGDAFADIQSRFPSVADYRQEL